MACDRDCHSAMMMHRSPTLGGRREDNLDFCFNVGAGMTRFFFQPTPGLRLRHRLGYNSNSTGGGNAAQRTLASCPRMIRNFSYWRGDELTFTFIKKTRIEWYPQWPGIHDKLICMYTWNNKFDIYVYTECHTDVYLPIQIDAHKFVCKIYSF